jgi:hypothetical protein
MSDMIITNSPPLPDRTAASKRGGPKAKDHKGPKQHRSLDGSSPFKAPRRSAPAFTPVENVPMNKSLLSLVSPPKLNHWMTMFINASPSHIGQSLLTAKNRAPQLFDFVNGCGHRQAMIRSGCLCLSLARPTIAELGFNPSAKVMRGDVVHRVREIGSWFVPGEIVIQMPTMIPSDKVKEGTDIVFCSSSDQFFIRDAKRRKSIRESGFMPDPRKQLLPQERFVVFNNLRQWDPENPLEFKVDFADWSQPVDPSHRFIIATDIQRV